MAFHVLSFWCKHFSLWLFNIESQQMRNWIRMTYNCKITQMVECPAKEHLYGSFLSYYSAFICRQMQNKIIQKLDLNIFHFISHEKGSGRARMLCHSPLPYNRQICIEIVIYSHNTFTHTHAHCHQRVTMLSQSLVWNKYSVKGKYYQEINCTELYLIRSIINS